MPGGQLPEGLVTTNNETVREEIENVDRVDLKDVARLWRGTQNSPSTLTPVIDAEAHNGGPVPAVDLCPATLQILTTNSQTTRRVEPSYITTPVRGWRTFSGGYGATRPSAIQFPGRLLPDFL
jgi:hypothetical protein